MIVALMHSHGPHVPVAKATKPADDSLTAEDRVILFVVAARIEPAAVGVTGQRMKRIFVRGLIDRERAVHADRRPLRGARGDPARSGGYACRRMTAAARS